MTNHKKTRCLNNLFCMIEGG